MLLGGFSGYYLGQDLQNMVTVCIYVCVRSVLPHAWLTLASRHKQKNTNIYDPAPPNEALVAHKGSEKMAN